MKFKPCCFCGDMVEIHHHKLHQTLCPLNDENLEKICNYLKRGIVDTRLLKRASFYSWAIETRVLTSITITNRFGLSNWQQSLYQLLVYGYLKGYIEFVYVEIILSIISNQTMWLTKQEYKKSYTTAMDNYKLENGLKGELFYNHYLLLMHILHRANKDMLLPDGSLDENKDVVDVQDATTFMYLFAQDIIKHRYENNLLGYDATVFYQQLMTEP